MTKVKHDSTVSLQLLEGTKAKLFLIVYKNNSYQPANTSGTLHRTNMVRLVHKKNGGKKYSAGYKGGRTALNKWCGMAEDRLRKGEKKKKETRSLTEILSEQLST